MEAKRIKKYYKHGMISVVFVLFIILSWTGLNKNMMAATYTATGTLISTNLLSGIGGVVSIDSFTTSSTVPANTTMWVQFSQNSSSWYDHLGTLNATTSVPDGISTTTLSALHWLGSNFYYKIGLTSDGTSTPTLDTITLAYTINAEMAGTNYRIQSSSVNTGGIDVSTSTTYRIEDTLGEVATGESAGTLYKIKAGYRQMQESYISISGGGAVTMAPSIGGLTGGTASGTTSVTVITDNGSGYSLSIKAGSSPALMSGGNSFADYTPTATSTPDYAWGINAADSEFGFTPEGTDIVQKYKDDNGSSCNTGSNDTPSKCWYGLTTSNESIASSVAANSPSGTQTTVRFQAQSGSSHIQSPGTYTAEITLTAITN